MQHLLLRYLFIPTALRKRFDVVVQIPSVCELHNDEEVILVTEALPKRDYIRMVKSRQQGRLLEW